MSHDLDRRAFLVAVAATAGKGGLGRMTYTVKHHCVEGWSAIATWTGVPFQAFATLAGVQAEARYVRFDSFDADYYNGWDLKSAMHPETILAYGFNDRELMPEHG